MMHPCKVCRQEKNHENYSWGSPVRRSDVAAIRLAATKEFYNLAIAAIRSELKSWLPPGLQARLWRGLAAVPGTQMCLDAE